MYEQSMNHIYLNIKGKPRCYERHPLQRTHFAQSEASSAVLGVEVSYLILEWHSSAWPYPYCGVASMIETAAGSNEVCACKYVASFPGPPHIRTHTLPHTCAYVHMCTYVRTHTCTHMHTYAHAHACHMH